MAGRSTGAARCSGPIRSGSRPSATGCRSGGRRRARTGSPLPCWTGSPPKAIRSRGPEPVRALVTGAASGIGRATCLRLARDAQAAGRKAQIAAVDLGPSPALESLVKELANLGAVAMPLHGDMATADAPGRVVDEAI